MRAIDFDATMRYGHPPTAIATIEVVDRYSDPIAEVRDRIDAFNAAFLKARAAHAVRIREKILAFEAGGMRFCDLCDVPLTVDVLLEQAEQLMKPFAGRARVAFDATLQAEIAELLEKSASPFNAGADCCYSCAYGLHQSVSLELVR